MFKIDYNSASKMYNFKELLYEAFSWDVCASKEIYKREKSRYDIILEIILKDETREILNLCTSHPKFWDFFEDDYIRYMKPSEQKKNKIKKRSILSGKYEMLGAQLENIKL